jgi:hypothetical protein
MNPGDVQYAAAEVRDRFLIAIDRGDWQGSMRLALGLATCANPLPGLVCRQLDLPARSTYGCAARRVLALCQDANTARSVVSGDVAAPLGLAQAAAAWASAGEP